MNNRRVYPLALRLDGRPAEASTTIAADTGPYVAVLATTLPDSGLELHSTYTGHQGAETRAVHLLLARGRPAETLAADHRGRDLPVWAARELCLLDHYAMLQRLAQLSGNTIAVDVDDALLLAADLPAPAA